jgi:8-oxo-dGTP diphosphatase
MKEYAGIIVRANNKCLMCKRASSHIFLPNVWSIPSGHVEDGETPIDGAIREFVEETNMEVTNIKYVSAIINNDKDGNPESKMYIYTMNLPDEILPDLKSAKDGHEHTECGYFSKEELPKTTEKLKKVLEILLK